MSKELDLLFEEAKEDINQGNIQKGFDILKVLVESGYEPAMPLYEKYKNITNEEKNTYPNSDHPNFNYRNNRNRPKYKNNHIHRHSNHMPLWTDPSNKVWLYIVLYAILVIEGIFLFLLFLQLLSGREDYFFMGLIGLVIFHLVAMLSLNISFNIQTIKEDVKDIKKRL